MRSDDQDGVASVPSWYRKLIVWLHGAEVMQRLDRAGKHHDESIVRYGLKIANARMRKKMRLLRLPFWTVRFPVSLAIWIYRLAPQELKDEYWGDF